MRSAIAVRSTFSCIKESFSTWRRKQSQRIVSCISSSQPQMCLISCLLLSILSETPAKTGALRTYVSECERSLHIDWYYQAAIQGRVSQLRGRLTHETQNTGITICSRHTVSQDAWSALRASVNELHRRRVTTHTPSYNLISPFLHTQEHMKDVPRPSSVNVGAACAPYLGYIGHPCKAKLTFQNSCSK